MGRVSQQSRVVRIATVAVALAALASLSSASCPSNPVFDSNIELVLSTGGGRLGVSVAASGDGGKVLAGARTASAGSASAAGAVVYATVANVTSANPVYTNKQVLISDSAFVGQEFGQSIAAANWSRIVIGEPEAFNGVFDTVGKFHSFSINSTGYYVHTQSVVADAIEIGTNQNFAQNLAIDESATTLLVGLNPRQVGGVMRLAIVYKYNGSMWIADGQINGSASISGTPNPDTVAMSAAGTWGAVGVPSDNTGAAGSGSVTIVKRNPSAGGWNATQTLRSPAQSSSGAFGSAVEISADGKVLAVGAPGEATMGRVYMYRLNTSTGMFDYLQYLHTNLTSAVMQFGASIALSSNGSQIAVGAPGLDSNSGGVVLLQETISNIWIQRKFVPSDFSGSLFGSAVAMTSDGSASFVGAPLANSNNGAVVQVLTSACIAQADTYFCGDGQLTGSEQCELGSGSCCNACFFRSSSHVCDAKSGDCENDALCTGSSATCPSKTLVPAGTVCLTSPGPCQNNSVCSGSSVSCPGPQYIGNATVCRPANGPCDLAETCTGDGATCPSNQLLPAGSACTTNGTCQAGGVCLCGPLHYGSTCNLTDTTVPTCMEAGCGLRSVSFSSGNITIDWSAFTDPQTNVSSYTFSLGTASSPSSVFGPAAINSFRKFLNSTSLTVGREYYATLAVQNSVQGVNVSRLGPLVWLDKAETVSNTTDTTISFLSHVTPSVIASFDIMMENGTFSSDKTLKYFPVSGDNVAQQRSQQNDPTLQNPQSAIPDFDSTGVSFVLQACTDTDCTATAASPSFAKPVVFTVDLSQASINVGNQSLLLLYYDTSSSSWKYMQCPGYATSEFNQTTEIFTGRICHFTQFGLYIGDPIVVVGGGDSGVSPVVFGSVVGGIVVVGALLVYGIRRRRRRRTRMQRRKENQARGGIQGLDMNLEMQMSQAEMMPQGMSMSSEMGESDVDPLQKLLLERRLAEIEDQLVQEAEPTRREALLDERANLEAELAAVKMGSGASSMGSSMMEPGSSGQLWTQHRIADRA